jgi:anaerobic selenocysteine-containing dehydrogenase
MSFLSIADPLHHRREAAKRGANLRHVNPRRVEPSDAKAGETVLIRPDTDLYLMASMLCEIERAGLFREDLLARRAHNLEGLRAFIRRHPPERTARARGLESGASARIESRAGALKVVVEIDESPMPGVAALTHGWANQATPGMRAAQRHPGVNLNRLLPTGPGSFEPLSKQAFMTGVPVEVTAL